MLVDVRSCAFRRKDGASRRYVAILEDRGPGAAIDRFCPYPTVSIDTTDLSDLVPDSADFTAVRLQFARFGQHCRLFAPDYRQATIAGLRRRLASGSTSNASEVANADVLAAWRESLARDNRGRGAVLIGHSQGGRLLMQLILREIEGAPLQARSVSAVLLGVGGAGLWGLTLGLWGLTLVGLWGLTLEQFHRRRILLPSAS